MWVVEKFVDGVWVLVSKHKTKKDTSHAIVEDNDNTDGNYRVRNTRPNKDQIMKDLGLTKVRGANGGIYYE